MFRESPGVTYFSAMSSSVSASSGLRAKKPTTRAARLSGLGR